MVNVARLKITFHNQKHDPCGGDERVGDTTGKQQDAKNENSKHDERKCELG